MSLLDHPLHNEQRSPSQVDLKPPPMLHHRARFLAGMAGLLLSLLSSAAAAQIEHGGLPPSQRRPLQRVVPTQRMRPVDRLALQAEDQAAGHANGGHGPLRFADVLPVELGLRNAGVWEELGNGDRVWRLRLESRGAYSLALVFRRFQLPERGELFVYDDARRVVRGAYTELENQLDGEFAIQPTPGQALTLEYFEPARARGQGELELALVVHDYRDVLGTQSDKSGSGGSGACEVDVACPAGAPWQLQSKSVVKVLSLPTGLECSGALLNNTANDGTALVVSAEHCGSLTHAVFTFNYERPACGSGAAPTTDTLVGATELVVDPTLDFRLARLRDPIPSAYGAFLAGWDRSDVAPTNTATIHHPGGDVKKVSLDNDPPGKASTFWKVFRWDVGVTEGGSSGAPLFTPQGRFIGQLKGGSSSCLFLDGEDFYGRLALQWSLVEPFLDPIGSGQTILDGLDPSTVTPLPYDVTGIYPPVETLIPGTRKIVRVLGTGFDNIAGMAIDGVVLSNDSFVPTGNTWINLDPPQLDIGSHTLIVRQAGVDKFLSFDVIAPPAPRYQVMNGDPGDPVISFSGLDFVYGGTPGSVHYFFWSFSNVPSVHPLLSLGLGNNFTQLRHCGIVTIPPRGWTTGHMPIRGGVVPPETTVYSQTACINCGVPLPASNLQESFFLF